METAQFDAVVSNPIHVEDRGLQPLCWAPALWCMGATWVGATLRPECLPDRTQRL